MSNKTEFVSEVKYRLLAGACWTVSLLPDWFLYHVLLDIVYFCVYRVAHYRVRVTRENLRNSFPEKSTKELRRIERRFYYQLAEDFIDVIDFASISRSNLMRRLQVENLREHLDQTAGSNTINMLAHYGDWEYMGAYALHDLSCNVIGVYHPLHDKAFDRYYKTFREKRIGVVPVPMKELTWFYLRHRDGLDGRTLALGMIADQNPWGDKRNRWIKFLNQPTRFYLGSGKIAVHYGLPVYFVNVDKVSRAHYRIRFEMIYDGKEPVDEIEITERYAARLEQMIRRRPELWMWSHKRWKRKPSPEALLEYEQRYATK